ncbi:RidA family protein [Histomonas meleagridis]|uniref:RidA family protein n=1 Tax=Histomonas meleagridis TaxID=135588 RepID=UPI00355A1E79|nr:RidA family protein [Histomonas meleagridis]KAH0797228.1 RidA family protein [Histomonas meleagridis]
MSREIHTDDAPPAIGHYVQARVVKDTLYTSGIVGQDPKGGPTPEDVAGQTKIALQNLDAILKAANFTKHDIVRCDVYIANMDDFKAFDNAYIEYFGDYKPCRCTVQAAKLCDPFKVEMEVIAVLSN